MRSYFVEISMLFFHHREKRTSAGKVPAAVGMKILVPTGFCTLLSWDGHHASIWHSPFKVCAHCPQTEGGTACRACIVSIFYELPHLMTGGN